MTVISLTFHATADVENEWQIYLKENLFLLVENLFDVEKYMIAGVNSDMIAEGSNTNVLLFFANEEKREDFLGIELQNITEHIESRFGQEIMIFTTLLDPKKLKL